VLLWGCSGGAPTPDEEHAAKAAGDSLPVTLDDRPLIVCFGDSLTAGLGVDPDQSYPARLQQLIDDAGYEYRVVNDGVSGETTQAGLVRTGMVAAREPRFVILAFGGNDGLRGLSVENMEANLREMISRLQQEGIQVILAGIKLPPNYGSEYTSAFEAVFPRVASEMDVPLIPFLLEGVGGHPEFMQDDGLHPNAEGARRVAHNVWEVLEPLLAAEREKRPAAPVHSG